MMVSISHCFRSAWLEIALRVVAILLLTCFVGIAQAQNSAEISQFSIERVDDEVLMSAQVVFDLPAAVEDALIKGIAMYFSAEVDVLRERWYWYDKKVASAERHMRLVYQPLTRRWRLNVTAGASREGSLGLALNQTFDTLNQALDAIKRLSRWKVADAADLDASMKHKVEFRFRLDLSQLPRPFQIGALGQADWDIAASIRAPVSLDVQK